VIRTLGEKAMSAIGEHPDDAVRHFRLLERVPERMKGAIKAGSSLNRQAQAHA
jgi:hypothetical protein